MLLIEPPRGVNREDRLLVHLLLLQVPPLVQELRTLSPNIKSTLAASVLKQLETGIFAKIEEETRDFSEKNNRVCSPISSKWSVAR